MANGMERRDFLKVLGAAGAGASLFGCSTEGAERLIPYVTAADEIVPGLATWYRTTCRECPAGCGMSIKTREGRAIKAEGNPLSPISHGRLCARGQASLHGLYNPDRVPQALVRDAAGAWSRIGWDDAEQRLAAAIGQARGRKVFLTQTFTGSMDALVDQWAAAFGMEVVRFDTFGWEPIRAANRLLFGIDAVPVHDFSAADVVVSFGADFMETWLSPVDYSHGFTQSHAFRRADGHKGRFISVTGHQSLTDMSADEWLPVRPGTEHLVALAMARSIVDAGQGRAGAAAGLLQRIDVADVARTAGVPEERIRSAARAFAAGPSLAVGPGVQTTHARATSVAMAVALLNYVAGNFGTTVRFDRTERFADTGSYRDLAALIASMADGQVGALVVHGPNPLYSVPLAGDAAAAIERVPFIASFSPYLDETSESAHLLLPDHHFLESWGDYEPRTGVHSIVQPVMTPVFRTKQTGDVLLSVARRVGVAIPTAATTYYDYLRERWARDIYPQAGAAAPFDEWWRETLQLGVVVTDAPAAPAVSLNAGALAQLDLETPQFSGDGDLLLVAYPSYRFYDGRTANRPWLQELPDPVSKISWTSWVEVNPQTAERLGLDTGSMTEVTTPHGTATLPVWIHPGTRPDVIAVQLGQGHEEFGRYARGRGVNAARFLAPVVEEPSGALVWVQTTASLRPTGEWQKLPYTAGSATQQGRDVARATTLEEARQAERARLVAAGTAASVGAQHGEDVGVAPEAGAAPHTGAPTEHGEAHPKEAQVRQLQQTGGFAPMVVEAGPQDYPPPGTYYGEYSEDNPRWAMAIDLERCNGCSACVVACYAENNIGIVGPEQISIGRIMTWMRIERYFEADEEGELHHTRFLPMLCQHCGNAPCEPVCPVYAAYHTPDGLNGQVYNRCVGTRYCSNNCPYKVRYFNWFSAEWPEPLNWQLNPDVAVREKGVMEKCTFCVQRIRGAQHQARLEGRAVADGEITPACAQTCPGDAIVFGDIKDPNSRVAQIAASGRGYRVLDELNTQSGIVYLKKVLTEASEA
ncbi:MAG TPA: molybdopterin dinucleotide binding domain-containing protein [Longimicrobiales bacterium]